MEAIQLHPEKEFTVKEFLKLEEELCQLINGKVITSPSPTSDHQRISRELFKLLLKSTQKGELLFAPMDVFLMIKMCSSLILLYVSENNKAIINKEVLKERPI